jgi:predicted nucleic acid-binding protein
MAHRTLVLDASVGVKWFSAIGEDDVPQARSLMKAHACGDIKLLIPDLFFHEISNTLVQKKTLSINLIEESLTTLFDLDLSIITISEQLLQAAVRLARKANITEYDACYVAIAIENHCPLVTANPKHQKQNAGCRVIPLEEWKMQE